MAGSQSLPPAYGVPRRRTRDRATCRGGRAAATDPDSATITLPGRRPLPDWNGEWVVTEAEDLVGAVPR